MVFLFLCIFAVYGTSNFYIGKKIFIWLKLLFPNINSIIYRIIYSCVALIIPLNLLLAFLDIPLSLGIKSFLSILGYYWMIVYFSLLLFFMVSDIILFIGRLLKIVPIPIPKNTTLITGLLIFITIVGLLSYGTYNGNKLKTTSYNVKVEKNTSLNGLNIVLISDLHFGYISDAEYIANLVDNVNRLKPDVVCITGDIFDGNYYNLTNPTKAIKLLNSIKSKYGVYACLGNHDAGKSYNQIISFLEKSNIKLLNDEHVVIDNKFVLVGRKDSSPIGDQGKPRGKTVDIFNKINKDMPIIVMDHRPSNIVEYGNEVDLIFSGHTHRGQIFPGNIVTNSMFPVDYGYYQKDKNSPQVIVSSGAATWGPPLRIGSNNEIVNIKVKFNK